MKSIRIAIAGNPNVGKSTLFNKIAGSDQHVGNYPGVTVERKEGRVSFKDYELMVIDLPGIYSMNAFSPEEIVTRNYIAEERPDVIINIVDASNLEKNLYLTLQILEMKVPVVLFLNMLDSAEVKGIGISREILEKEVETPVIEGIAKKGTGINEVLEKCIEIYEKKPPLAVVPYSEMVGRYISRIKKAIELESPEIAKDWRAIRFIEGSLIERDCHSREVLDKIHEIIQDLMNETGLRIHSMVMVQERYHLIKNIVNASMCVSCVQKEDVTDKIDKLVLHRIWSMPIFLFMLFSLFQVVFTLGEPIENLLALVFDQLGNFVASLWTQGTDSLLKNLIVEGIIGGVGGILVFTPYIFLVFMTISLLEDSGYMSRVAVIMDKWMGKIGLSGKSFMPMILGFGCTVPAVMGARIIENKFERLATIMVIPFMSCGARLPVYLLIISAFVPLKFQAVVLLLVYATGVFFAAVSAKILRLTIFKGEENPLIIELPKYSTPSLKSVWMLTWHRGKHFLEKAGTIILFASIVLWVLNTFPHIDTEELTGMSENDAALLKAENSFSGRIGKAIEPAFKIMDADWKVASSFLASLAAKELFVSQMSILHAMGSEDENSAALQNKFKEEYSLATAIAIILFILLSAPCVATFAVVKVETDSWFWPTVQYAGMIIIAYFAALAGFFIFK
ncbi:MAG TPA: ferrous iron transport protein B [bacterium]|nr:ferrous iron transport protein B [bacterium]HQN72004.1 ferrous iron transport protein B [bacterium]HQO90954.1 ferrous iron transport protein B [bacterium]